MSRGEIDQQTAPASRKSVHTRGRRGESNVTVRVGVTGAGTISRGHFKALVDCPEADVVAVCDTAVERAATAAQALGPGCAVFSDYHEMLNAVDLDCVFLLIPPYTRTDHEIAAIERGLSLFIEKPVALDLPRAARIQRAIEESGAITATGHQLRHHEGTDRVRDFLQDRDIGMAWGSYLGPYVSSPPQKAAWFNQRSRSGGQVVAQLCHSMDTARYLLGEPRRLWARHALRLLGGIDNFDIPDVSAGTVEFESGVIAQFFCSFAPPVTHRVGFFAVVARDALAEITFEGSIITLKDELRTFEAAAPAQTHQDRAFIKAIETGDRSLVRSPYEDAVKTLDFTLAFEHAADTGEVVEFERGRSQPGLQGAY